MTTGTSRHRRHCTTAKTACGTPSFAIPLTNCGPTAYPTANRNIKNANALSGCEIVIPICPISTPARRVAVTAPKPMPRKVNLPKKYPIASVIKIAISGYVLSVVANHCMMLSLKVFSCWRRWKLGNDVHDHRAPGDQQDISDRVGNCVAQDGDLAVGGFLGGQERRGVSARSTGHADQDPAVDAREKLLADQQQKRVR